MSEHNNNQTNLTRHYQNSTTNRYILIGEKNSPCNDDDISLVKSHIEALGYNSGYATDFVGTIKKVIDDYNLRLTQTGSLADITVHLKNPAIHHYSDKIEYEINVCSSPFTLIYDPINTAIMLEDGPTDKDTLRGQNYTKLCSIIDARFSHYLKEYLDSYMPKEFVNKMDDLRKNDAQDNQQNYFHPDIDTPG